MWWAGKELSKRQERIENIQKEIRKTQMEIEKTVHEHKKAERIKAARRGQKVQIPSISEEYQGYCDKLNDGLPERNEDVSILGLFWLLSNHQAEKARLCPEQCQRIKDLQDRLGIENKQIRQFERMSTYPWILNNANYHRWREYHKTQKDQKRQES